MESVQQLVGRQVLRNFGKHGVHKGTITSYDDEGELTFRIEYQDGDFEDLAEGDVRDTLIDKVRDVILLLVVVYCSTHVCIYLYTCMHLLIHVYAFVYYTGT